MTSAAPRRRACSPRLSPTSSTDALRSDAAPPAAPPRPASASASSQPRPPTAIRGSSRAISSSLELQHLRKKRRRRRRRAFGAPRDGGEGSPATPQRRRGGLRMCGASLVANRATPCTLDGTHAARHELDSFVERSRRRAGARGRRAGGGCQDGARRTGARAWRSDPCRSHVRSGSTWSRRQRRGALLVRRDRAGASAVNSRRGL